jgi:hypothetical protein
MSSQWKRSTLTISRDVILYDETNGNGREIEWTGRKEEIMGQANVLTGARKRITNNGAVYTLTATWQGTTMDQEPSAELPIDKWSYSTEVLEKDLFSLPVVVAAAQAHAGSNSSKFKVDMENYIKEPTTDPDSFGDSTALPSVWGTGVTVSTIASKVATELRRGATHYEDARLVVRRQRSFNTRYPIPTPLYSLTYIYSTAELSYQFALPSYVHFSLPDTDQINADYPVEQAEWGFRLRTQQSDVVGTKVEQMFEWSLAAWSTFTYDLF